MEGMNCEVIDLETTIHNRGEGAVGNNKASPFHPDNHVVLAGHKKAHSITTYKPAMDCVTLPKDLELLIGHNIKFDLHYMFRYPEWREWAKKGKIWDTQLAEYILSGQTKLYPSLDECAAKYGGTLKDDRIKEFWNEGIDTEDIPEEMLREYLEGDVTNTELVFQHQIVKAEELGMLNLIWSQMDALLCTVEMEWNGMHFDKGIAAELSKDSRMRLAHITESLEAIYIASGIGNPKALSNDHISLVLFGGEYKYTGVEPVLDEDGEFVLYKSGARKGEPKTKKVTKTRTIAALFVPKKEWAAKKKGFFKVNDEVLSDPMFEDAGVVKLIKEARTLKKDISTYFDGYSDLVWHDNKIHQSLNHVSTATGRLSCTKPNLQNVTSHED